MKYLDRDLNFYNLDQLKNILKGLQDAETSRNAAGSNHKFTRTDGKAMEFPPPNIKFVELKTAIENEIKSRN